MERPSKGHPTEGHIPLREAEKIPPKLYIYAGSSGRRELFLIQAFPFPNTVIVQQIKTPEPEIEDVVAIANWKIEQVSKLETAQTRLRQNPNGIIISADVKNRSLILLDTDLGTSATEPKPEHSESLGKPKSEEEVRSNFNRMARTKDPYYTAEAGTVIDSRKGRFKNLVAITIHLDRRKMQEFSSVQGFERYKQAFRNFYSSDIYASNGLEPAELIEIAGGFSLGVLLSLGAVTAIDGTPKGDPKFRHVVKRALYHVLIGFDIGLLRKHLRPDIERVIDTDAWLGNVTSHAMGETSAQA